MRKFAIAALAVLLLAGCGAPAATDVPTPSAETVAETLSATPTIATPSPPPSPTPTPAPTSLTSGLPNTAEYKPVMVMIENMPEARPHSGIGQADIVYEAFMEAKSVTRFLLIFNDTLPEVVGPVRSCRIYFLDIAQEYKGLLAFFGGPKSNGHPADLYSRLDKADIALAVDGTGGKYGKLYWRSKDRSAPHNVYTNLNEIAATHKEPIEPVSHFQYSETGLAAGDAATAIQIVYNKRKVDTTYEYDTATGKYLRFIGGKPMVDKLDDKQVSVTNVIVQQADHRSLGTSKSHINIDLIDSGKADIFSGDRHVSGTWKRDSVKDITRFYDESGAEVTLQPGNTWIQIVDDNTPFTYAP